MHENKGERESASKSERERERERDMSPVCIVSGLCVCVCVCVCVCACLCLCVCVCLLSHCGGTLVLHQDPLLGESPSGVAHIHSWPSQRQGIRQNKWERTEDGYINGRVLSLRCLFTWTSRHRNKTDTYRDS